MKIIIEYDNNKLKNISMQLYNLFKTNYDTILLDNNITENEKNNYLKNNNNYFLLSNKLNNNNNIDIIYPLQENDELARELNSELSKITTVNKFYQLRSSSKTNLNYYSLFNNINGNGIIIKYGDNIINNGLIPKTIYEIINSYLNNQNIYIVKSGDSLYSISKRFNTTVDELKIINNLSNNLLSIGQKLIIPNSNNTSSDNDNIYIVKSGDSLYSISKKYNTTVDELKNVNNLSSNLLSIGQKLIIPSTDTIYIVKKGDSLYAISKLFNTTVDKIKNDNNLTSNLLSIGQKLIIKK